MKKYTVLIEKTGDGYSASVPILPGCVAMADTKTKVEELIYEAILLHIEGMESEGLPLPVENETDIEVMVFS